MTKPTLPVQAFKLAESYRDGKLDVHEARDIAETLLRPLLHALEFYANPDLYRFSYDFSAFEVNDAYYDDGETAREALKHATEYVDQMTMLMAGKVVFAEHQSLFRKLAGCTPEVDKSGSTQTASEFTQNAQAAPNGLAATQSGVCIQSACNCMPDAYPKGDGENVADKPPVIYGNGSIRVDREQTIRSNWEKIKRIVRDTK